MFWHKFLPHLFSPITLFIIILFFCLVIKARKTAFLALFAFAFSSTPLISNELMIWIERDHQPLAINSLKKADGIIVLSGMTTKVRSLQNSLRDFNGSVDRIFATIKLYKSNIAPKIIIASGYPATKQSDTEGYLLSMIAQSQGVPSRSIKLLTPARNTEEEAIAVKAMGVQGSNHFYLVTSAFHMNRAINIFEHYGISVKPFAADFRQENNSISLLNFIPQASALTKTSIVVRELIGRSYYKLKFYLSG